MKKGYETREVFVPVGVPSITFVRRMHLERSVESWKMSRAKHMLIFGASKSGKTSLWKHYISDDSVIKIPCNHAKTISEIYNEILRELEAYYTPEREKELGLKVGFVAEIKALLGFGSATLKSSAEGAVKYTTSEKEVSKPVIGANLVIKYLKPSKKYVVLEDFHYASEDLRRLLSQDLKAFSDENCPWIIVGIQHKTSELLSYNMDLQQRIAEIPVEGFSQNDLAEIIGMGELALNLAFGSDLKARILAESLGSASLVQNICQRICIIQKIYRTCDSECEISDTDLIKVACEEIAKENAAYYEKVVRHVAYGGRSDGSTEKYKWFLKMIREVPIPEHGLKNTAVYKHLLELGHSSIEQGSVTSGLGFLPKLLEKSEFPTFFDYDVHNKTFYLLDKYMKFVFRWSPGLIDGLFNNDLDQDGSFEDV